VNRKLNETCGKAEPLLHSIHHRSNKQMAHQQDMADMSSDAQLQIALPALEPTPGALVASVGAIPQLPVLGHASMLQMVLWEALAQLMRGLVVLNTYACKFWLLPVDRGLPEGCQ